MHRSKIINIPVEYDNAVLMNTSVSNWNNWIANFEKGLFRFYLNTDYSDFRLCFHTHILHRPIFHERVNSIKYGFNKDLIYLISWIKFQKIKWFDKILVLCVTLKIAIIQRHELFSKCTLQLLYSHQYATTVEIVQAYLIIINIYYILINYHIYQYYKNVIIRIFDDI